MGVKGAKETEGAATTAEDLVASLAPLGDVRSRKMFGGYGVFAEDTMFAIVDSAGKAFLRADDASCGPFEAAGSERHSRMPYWQIPDPVLAEKDELVAWATRSLHVARAAKK